MIENNRISVDIGGTFTDIVLQKGKDESHIVKVSSSTDDYARAIVEGVGMVLEQARLNGNQVSEIRHATTIASNAILEHKGARVGLITTKGFRDVLEIRNLRVPRLYDLRWEKPKPLVPRYLRAEVEERIDAAGSVQIPLDKDEVVAVVEYLLQQDAVAIAVCLINSYMNDIHEARIKEIVEDNFPDVPVCISSEILPEIKEFERTSTTVINAYVAPVVSNYLNRLRAGLDSIGVEAPILLLQSNGGLTTLTDAGQRPVNIIESGPAGGVVGARQFSANMPQSNVITFDMGGTTAKASMVENGLVSLAEEYHVGAGMMVGSKLLTGAGYLLKIPTVDLSEVGAGGGSIVWIDAGGSLQVGPHSAGSNPGPICYDLGGKLPTITDANILLGYINPEYLVGGSLRLREDITRKIFSDEISKPLNMNIEDAAYAAHMVAISTMIRAIKAISTERGRDPRDFALFAFGGNGPLFAAGLARELGMNSIIVPRSSGVFSATGLLCAKLERLHSETYRRALNSLTADELVSAWKELQINVIDSLEKEGFTASEFVCAKFATLRYQGQSLELLVSVPEDKCDQDLISYLTRRYGEEHERAYGHKAGAEEPVEIVNLRIVAQSKSDSSYESEAHKSTISERKLPPKIRKAYFGPDLKWLDCQVLDRSAIGNPETGPLIIEEYDATCLVPPGARALLDDQQNILIELE